MSARALMVLGTASNVGKSLFVTALCRHFARAGVRVAPFKAQNMSLNSAATPEGGEIGRAQALQAEAAFLAPAADMNPVLIKPEGEDRAQVVVQGRVYGTFRAADYRRRIRDELFTRVLESYERLARAHDLIVIEGAGSPAEINLREGDIVNMAMAHAADARCMLVGDIDRGGVFAALYGTLALLDERDRARIHGFAINKFRGDRGLLDPGVERIAGLMGIPSLGVVPYLRDIGLEDEDSVALEERLRPHAVWPRSRDGDRLRVAVVALPSLANFTDFDALASEPSVDLRYTVTCDDVARADVVILPGSKRTIADLDWLRAGSLARAVCAAAEQALVLGICGGFQMLGTHVSDPSGAEGGGSRDGLGLLPVRTELTREKVTIPVAGALASVALFGSPVARAALTGYEIHLGRSERSGCPPFARVRREGSGEVIDDGAAAENGRVAGTYVHGLFSEDAFRHAFVDAARHARGLGPAARRAWTKRERQARIDRLADCVAGSLDLAALLPALAARA